MFRVTLRVVMDVDLTSIDKIALERLRATYQPTPESPDADDEWLAEEWAMSQIANAAEIEVLDSHITR